VNAFWRVAPSLRLRLLAIFLAGVLLRAADFNSRTSPLVQGRRFEFLLAIERFSQSEKCAYSWKGFLTKVFAQLGVQTAVNLPLCSHLLVAFQIGPEL
jgi:hypothetical protein